MFTLLGDDTSRARANAATVMAIETELAGASRKLEDLRDPRANYNAMSVEGVSTLTPSIRWRDFLEQSEITRRRQRGGRPAGVLPAGREVAAGAELDEWKAYLRWQLATNFAEPGRRRFDAENFRSSAPC
jgi:putative endopeptidase